MYETMLFWETAHTVPDLPPHIQEFTDIWQTADKVVYSKTLGAISTKRTRLERDFDPKAVEQMKTSAARDLAVGGAELGGRAIKAGLVDEIELFLTPVVVGNGKRALPDEAHLRLELEEERRFGCGVVYLRYRTV
jgi:dihydrofolate reductase